MRQGEFYNYLQMFNIRLKDLVEHSGLSQETLRNWFYNPKKHKALELLCWGFVFNRQQVEALNEIESVKMTIKQVKTIKEWHYGKENERG